MDEIGVKIQQDADGWRFRLYFNHELALEGRPQPSRRAAELDWDRYEGRVMAAVLESGFWPMNATWAN